MQPSMRDISDTALWAAVFRAHETERQDALFRDPFASRLAGPRGDQIVGSTPHAGDNSWAWVVRTYLFDRLIAAEIAAGIDMVVNLAAGLDARPYRLDLPASFQWVEIDLPRMISYKEEVLAAEKPRCRLTRIAMDLGDPAARRNAFARLEASRILVLTEGLLVYFSNDEVAALARDLAAAPGVASWLLDQASPGLVGLMRQTMGGHLSQAGARFQFGPAEGPEFFTRCGWRVRQVQPILRAAVEVKRVPPELQAFAAFPDPTPPFRDEMWSAVCLLGPQST
jgi:methyltransferase (TIGR00027 family)